MTVVKFLGVALSILGVAILAVVIFFMFSISSTLSENCNRIAKIAQDESVVFYLNEWANEHILNKGFYSVHGMHGRIGATSNDEGRHTIPLPIENMSGIEHEYIRFSIDKKSDSFEDPITTDNVKKINIGRGRDSVILLRNGYSMTSHRGYDEASGHLLKINESVFVYCANATFKE